MKETKRKHIIFILPSLAAGGSERVFSYLVQNMDANKFNCELLVLGNQADNAYAIDESLVNYFNKEKVSRAIVKLYQFIKSKKPDVIISSMAHLNIAMAFLSLFFPKIKFVARESSVLSELYKYDYSILTSKILVKIAYKKFDLLVSQSEDMRNDMIKNFGIKPNKTVSINNPITSDFKIKGQAVSKPLKFITIGRLSKEKGHDRILKVLSRLKFPFHYTIIGNGPEKNSLDELIKSYSLVDKITFVPFTQEINKYLIESDVFLQGSYVDGFPNALLESCMSGIPIVAFDAPGGVKEIVVDGENGYLVKSKEEFAGKLNSLNNDFPFEPKKVKSTVDTKFDSKKILSQYEDLFLKI